MVSAASFFLTSPGERKTRDAMMLAKSPFLSCGGEERESRNERERGRREGEKREKEKEHSLEFHRVSPEAAQAASERKVETEE